MPSTSATPALAAPIEAAPAVQAIERAIHPRAHVVVSYQHEPEQPDGVLVRFFKATARIAGLL